MSCGHAPTPSGEVLRHCGNVAKLNNVALQEHRAHRWSLGENQRSLHDRGGL